MTGNQKKYGILVFIMSIIFAILETFGVSIIFPLLQAFLNPEELMGNKYVGSVVQFLGLEDYREVIFLVCIAIVIIYLFKNAFGLLYTWVSNKYACKVHTDFKCLYEARIQFFF